MREQQIAAALDYIYELIGDTNDDILDIVAKIQSNFPKLERLLNADLEDLIYAVNELVEYGDSFKLQKLSMREKKIRRGIEYWLDETENWRIDY